jgi:hypothetical protein
MLNLNDDTKLINLIILNKKLKMWEWYTKVSHNKKLNFTEYIKSVRYLKNIKKKYIIIYKWLHRRLFINKSIKLLEYFYRPYNEGYYLAYNHFHSLL